MDSGSYACGDQMDSRDYTEIVKTTETVKTRETVKTIEMVKTR